MEARSLGEKQKQQLVLGSWYFEKMKDCNEQQTANTPNSKEPTRLFYSVSLCLRGESNYWKS
jgi:hypothetical protein